MPTLAIYPYNISKRAKIFILQRGSSRNEGASKYCLLSAVQVLNAEGRNLAVVYS